MSAKKTEEMTQQGQHVQQYVNPSRGKAQWLTFEYAFAMGSAVLAIMIITDVIISLFGGWAGNGSAVSPYGGSWLMGMFAISTITSATGLVTMAIAAVILSALSLVLFARVSRTIPEREGYTQRIAYKAITYGALAVLVLPALEFVAKLVAIVVNSLLLIGYGSAAAVYKSLYLAEFLPYLLSLALISVGIVLIAKIINGVNASRLLTMIVLGVASAAFIASAITVAVQVRSVSKNLNVETSISDILGGGGRGF